MLVGVVAALEGVGWIPHLPVLEASERLAGDLRFVAGHDVFIAASFHITGFLAVTIGSSLDRRMAELVALKEELERRNHELELLYEMEREAGRTEDLQDLMDLIRRRIPRVLGVRACAIDLLEEEGAHLHFASVSGLDPSRSQKGPERRERVELPLDEVVRSGVESFRPEAREKGLRYELEIGAVPWEVCADRAGMRYLVTNLLSNAMKYTPEGGRVRLERDGREAAVLLAEDTGIGIPRAELPRLFTAFFGASNARSVETVGTGLGLAICRRIVKGHGGSIHMTTEKGRGTSFRVRLPLGPAGSCGT